MLTILTLINTVLLVIVLGDRIKTALDKTTIDDKVIEYLKNLVNKDK
jgi:hypothetical protein